MTREFAVLVDNFSKLTRETVQLEKRVDHLTRILGGVTRLSALRDVVLDNVQPHQILRYKSDDETWVNRFTALFTGPALTLTVAAGAVDVASTVTSTNIVLAGEGGLDDEVDTIDSDQAGHIIVVRRDPTTTITLKDGTGNLRLPADIVLDSDEKAVWLLYTGSNDWIPIAGYGSGATGPVTPHTHAGEDIVSGTIADARIASTITRDSEVFSIVLASDGSGSGLDADLLDGLHASAFALAAHTHPYSDLTSIPAAIDAIDGLTPAANKLAYYTGASSAALTDLSAFGRSLIDDINAADARSTLELGTIATEAETNYLLAAGTRPLTGDWDIGDGRHIKADLIRARDGDGLALQDDGGNGIFVEDGGQVGVGTAAPGATLEVVGTQTTGATILATRNLTAASTNSPVVSAIQDHASDDQPVYYARQDGSGAMMELEGESGSSPILVSTAGSATPGIIMRKANGTLAAKTQVLADELMGFFGVRGADGSSYSNATTGLFGFKAAENFTGSNEGVYGVVEVSPIGSQTRREIARFNSDGRFRVGPNTITPASIGHFYENTSAVDATAGLTVEQDGTGDAVVHHYLTGGQIWSSGIDNSDSDVYAISPAADLNSKVFRLTSTGDLTINGILRSGTAAPAGSATPLSFVSDGVTSSGTWTINVTSGTAITVIANGAGDVGDILFYDVICDPSSGITGAGGGTMTPGTNQDLFNDGGNICQLQCNADGSVTVQRTAGTLTYVVSLRLFWQ